MKNALDRQSIRKILVIQLRALGDAILSTSVFPLLKKYFPEAEVHYLTGKGMRGLFEGLPFLEAVLEYPYSPSYLPGVLKMFPEIRRQRYDLVIDFQGTPGTALLTFFSGAGVRLGWSDSPRRWAYNVTSDANQRYQYVPLQRTGILGSIGITETSQQTFVFIQKDWQTEAQRFLESHLKHPDQLRVNLSVKHKRQARQWFPDRFARLNDLLVEKYGAQTFFNHAPGESDFVRNVAALCKYPPIVLPAWSLPQFAAFLSLMDLHISYDNGVKHLAVALGVPTISLFGAADPVHWNVPDSLEHPFILPEVPCRFCGLRECGLMVCMEAIQPEAVLQLIPQIPTLRRKLVKQIPGA